MNHSEASKHKLLCVPLDSFIKFSAVTQECVLGLEVASNKLRLPKAALRNF